MTKFFNDVFNFSDWLALLQVMTGVLALIIAPETIKALYQRLRYKLQIYPIATNIREDRTSLSWILEIETKRQIDKNVSIFIHSKGGSNIKRFKFHGRVGSGNAVKLKIDEYGHGRIDIDRMPKNSNFAVYASFEYPDMPSSISHGTNSIINYFNEFRVRKYLND
ncbi:hypothetical protein [Rhizorhapis sp. SPR117]|uniref:hypothetical protein n=1 Tax=Rhizorhapis sp. SPR117 TaxID=2912611 RepID=UPI001F1B1031|nr:hypothetical protein [Rhizorhapis sp. SPR117]